MAPIATGSVSQPGFVERRHLDQLGEFDPLHQQLGDAVTAADHDRRARVEVDQRHPDLTPIARIDRPRAVDNREANARSQTRPRMNQAHHAVRNRHGNARRNERPRTRGELNVAGAEEIDACVTVVRPGGHRQIAIQTHDRQGGGHDA